MKWGRDLEALGNSGGWYLRNVVWMDPCSSIIPLAPRTIFDHKQADKGKGPRWISQDAKLYSRNLRSTRYAQHQAQHGDKRIWWFIVLARGQVRFPVMGEDWKQNGEGQAQMVEQLPKVLESIVGKDRKPRTVFTDRGPGFYNTGNGSIVKQYEAALKKHGFQPFAGEDAKWQPPDIADLLLHETVAAWVRKYFKKFPMTWSKDQVENVASFLKKLKEAERYINKNYKVHALSSSFPTRIKKLIKDKGRRQKK